MKHVAALVVRDGLRGEVAKQRRLEETLRDQREQQRADISKLNALINQVRARHVTLRFTSYCLKLVSFSMRLVSHPFRVALALRRSSSSFVQCSPGLSVRGYRGRVRVGMLCAESGAFSVDYNGHI